jgi:hypothetical protein
MLFIKLMGGNIMFKRVILILMAAMLVVTSGCAKKASNKSTTESANMIAPNADVSYTSSQEQKSKYDGEASQDTVLQDKKIIQNFQVSINANDVKNAANEIGNKAKSLGGYTEMEEIMEYGSNSSIRIPSQKVDLFIEYLEKSFDVTNKNKSIEDVTDVYVDNDARLKNLRAEESQVLEVLKKANTVDEILKVQTELYRVRGEIEVLESRKKTWDKQVDYSTVRLNINKKQIVSDNKIKILDSNEFLNSMGKGFKNTFMYLILTFQTIIIFLFSNLIPFAILGGLGYGSYRAIKKKKKQ